MPIMKLMIHTKNLELTPAINEWIAEKIGAMDKLFKKADEVEARVEIGRPSKHHQKGQVYYAEMNLKMGGQLLRATIEHEDLRTAVDFVRDDLERQIKKLKSKNRDMNRKPKRI